MEYKITKGFIRWSSWCYQNTINMSELSKVNIRKRSFCIFDRDHPYVVDLFYKPVYQTVYTYTYYSCIPIQIFDYKMKSFRYKKYEDAHEDYVKIQNKIEFENK